MAEDLSCAKVLLFAPKFFNYENSIKQELERQGASVHLYDERDNPSSVEKILLRKAHFLMDSRTNRFFAAVAEKEKSFNPDYVLFVNAEAINEKSLKMMKNEFPHSKFLVYMWDSCRNKHIKHLFHLFDSAFSFDLDDCKQYGINFRPLFFVSNFQSQSGQKQYKYDVSFIGTVHSDRAKILQQVKDYCDENGLSYYLYLYVPGKLLYTLRMILDPYLRHFDKTMVHLESVKKNVVAEVSAESRCIIDINHPKQTGLTMRTFEMVGLRRKIMTTNENIVKYDFYNPTDQIVLSRSNFSVSKEAILHDYEDIPDDIYNKYSIESWVKDVFGLQSDNFLKEETK